MNIVYVYADSEDEWNCAEWRCAIPTRAIQRTKEHHATLLPLTEFSQNTPKAQDVCADGDIIIVQRNLFGRTLTMIQHWKALDKTVIADFDDAYNYMHPSVKNYKFWMEGLAERKNADGTITYEKFTPHPLTQFKWGLQLVDAAAVPCRQLAEDWGEIVDTVIVPNYLELPKFLSVKPVPLHEEIVIGWGGSLSHLQSFTDSGVLTALKEVCRKRPKVRVMICGDPRVFEQIDLPEEQKFFSLYVPAAEWPQQLAWFDIGLAPLDGEYDKRRSWIKVMEYLVMKIPWVATDYPPYEDVRSYGKVVNNTPQEWENALMDMVDHFEDYRMAARGEPYQFALQQGIDENIPKIISTYAKIIEKDCPGASIW